MQTAVITESSEKTTSRSKIWTITAANEDSLFCVPLPLVAPKPLVDLIGALGEAEQATNQQHQIAARDLADMFVEEGQRQVNSSAVSPTSQESESSSRMRVISASPRPTLACLFLLRLREFAGKRSR